MSKRKKIIISIFSLALCVVVSFAWINELQNPGGRVFTIDLSESRVADSGFVVRLSVLNDDDETFDEITMVDDGENKPENLPTYEDFAPGARKKFRVDISNTGATPVRLRMILTDILCDNEELQNSIIIGTNGFNGFSSSYPAPTVQNKMLSDGMNDDGGFVLIDSVEIPPHNSEDEFVSIYFYVMFSADGSENLENMSFSIGKINFLTL